MLKINPGLIRAVQAATRPEDLYAMVQSAIELEHATIPPYLCAYFTLKLGTNQPAADIIRSVVIEEMLHMSIAANLMIAIGGRPQLNKPHFVPEYPTELPMGIGGGLIVPLAKCSLALVQDVFMKIEEPEHPIPIRANLDAAAQTYATIGQFYHALDIKLRELGQPAFKGDFSNEMVDNSWFPPSELFRITGPESATAAIAIIVKQGEGTTDTPLDPEDAPAHYYRFQEIVKGRRLVHDANAPHGFSYSGSPVILDTANIWNMQSNPDPDKLPPDSRARRLSLEFAYAYTSLLNALDETFNGTPDRIAGAMGLMYELRLLAQKVLATELPGQPGVATGLPFRYQPVLT